MHWAIVTAAPGAPAPVRCNVSPEAAYVSLDLGAVLGAADRAAGGGPQALLAAVQNQAGADAACQRYRSLLAQSRQLAHARDMAGATLARAKAQRAETALKAGPDVGAHLVRLDEEAARASAELAQVEAELGAVGPLVAPARAEAERALDLIARKEHAQQAQGLAGRRQAVLDQLAAALRSAPALTAALDALLLQQREAESLGEPTGWTYRALAQLEQAAAGAQDTKP